MNPKQQKKYITCTVSSLWGLRPWRPKSQQKNEWWKWEFFTSSRILERSADPQNFFGGEEKRPYPAVPGIKPGSTLIRASPLAPSWPSKTVFTKESGTGPTRPVPIALGYTSVCLFLHLKKADAQGLRVLSSRVNQSVSPPLF